MKKIFILISIVFCLTSCAKNNEQMQKEETIQITNGHWTKISKFEFENHEYISFSCTRKGAVVHDPNCKYCKIE